MSKKPFDSEVAKSICDCGNIAVVIIDDAGRAVDLAHALLDGGVNIMELTLRTPAALRALEAVAVKVPDMVVGAGTVLSISQLKDARNAGAAFAVAPGFNRSVVQSAMDMNFSFAPGVMTPSEIEGAVETGCRILKFFPASVVGGPQALKTLTAPYNHLGIKYIPLGGLAPDNTADYLMNPAVAACGGSWIAPAKLINESDWEAIRANASRATEIVKTVRNS
ncbi:MAG: bifunctional 4-hydroxy-2-oxoglutarate aldolase/2-dehydro-3-deoxy-phosphogluconate aldolase [Lentisphaerae bacterium]|jgi:2-dehydro-3-deoxyphosphogluconate aldolase/(4S)-4-hydroxy-2-oxoglutarate aldolase|nr:bifunctional 4-hydroxy-2-oxoglutarate aldolase/2-dehydro-3-deoxy-phosphogluconate aldolase [Lentisphaerota bacterium]